MLKTRKDIIPKSLSTFILLFFLLELFQCGSNKNGFKINTNLKKDKIVLGNTLHLSIDNPKNIDIKNIQFYYNGKEISESFNTSNCKLGIQEITAIINNENNPDTITKKITILNSKAPKKLSFEIIKEYPHDYTSYTQGLEFYKDTLYESTGLRGESKLRKLNFNTGEVLLEHKLLSTFFGEGLTVLNNKIFQLTWEEDMGFIYDPLTFKQLGTFRYDQSKQGWGLCNDGKILYKSDGTNKIYTLNPNTLEEEGFIQIYTQKGKIDSLNELEYINGKIYANIYQRNGVIIINPKNGAVEGVLDFSSLKKKVKQIKNLDVLNGLAFRPKSHTLFVTGKHWSKLFEIKINHND